MFLRRIQLHQKDMAKSGDRANKGSWG
jgi:hypothetical protein